jgi:hypothetical protein
MFQARQELLEDEWLGVRHSGEIPEIALYSALYYLAEDQSGPRLQLSLEETQSLRQAAAARYQEIILRDLCFENRALRIYRGVQRAIFNWHRFVAFCERHNEECQTLRQVTAEAFLVLLRKAANTAAPRSPSLSSAIPDSLDSEPSLSRVFNSSFHDLALFSRELGIADELVPPEISQLCYRDEDMKSTLQQQLE